MLRIVIISTIFMAITTALLAYSTTSRSDRFVYDKPTKALNELREEETVSRNISQISDVSIDTPTLSYTNNIQPIDPIPSIAPLKNSVVSIQGLADTTVSRPSLRKNTAISGLTDILAVALKQEMTGEQIEILIRHAEESGAIKVPQGWRRADGTLDTETLLATLANPVSQRQTARESQYLVKSGDSLAAIAYRHYGDSSALEEIFWVNRDQLDTPDALSEGLVLTIPAL